MCKLRGGLLGIVVVGTLLCISSTAGFAAGYPTTAEKRAACSSDLMRFCFSMSPNMDTVEACLRSHKPQLSSTCRALFDREKAK